MKNYIFNLILIFSFSFTFSQVTNEGEPKSWALNYNYTLQEKVLPSFDLNQVKLALPNKNDLGEMNREEILGWKKQYGVS